MKKIFFLLLLSFSALSFSVLSYSLELEIVPTAAEVLETEAAGLVARVDFEQADQLLGALERAEAYYQQEGLNLSHPPVAFVIFGPPVSIFFKENYQKNQKVVDLAAKLTALKVIDVKVCQFSYIKAGLDGEDLLPFVSTVPFGPDELTRLIEDEDYSYF